MRAWLTTHRALWLVLLLALALRLALWSQPLHQPANDEVEYVAVATDLLAGRGWVFYESYHWLRAPLYPLFLAGSLWLSGGNLHLAALPNIVLSVATVALVYVLTRQIIGRADEPNTYIRDTQAVPVIAALLTALLLTKATFASLYMSETLFSFLLAATFVALLQWKQTPTSSPSPSQPGLRRYRWLLLGGVCYGLATLTRSLPLAFLPVVMLWLLDFGITTTPSPERRRWRLASWATLRPKLLAGVLFALATLLPLLPWTLRNCQAYGSCILVETGFSYNLWAFNEPRESMGTIFETLEQIPNPAERAAEASHRGLERLQEDPAILLRKLGPNWDYFWRIKPIQDRFLMASYYADPPPLVFLGALIFDDLLYVLIALTALFGFVRSLNGPRLSATLLLGGWVVYVVVASLLTHGEGRYRHFVFLVLLPYAAIGLHTLWQVLRGRLKLTRTRPGHHLLQFSAALVAGLLALLLLQTVIQHYPWQWASQGAERSIHRLSGDVALALGDEAAAEAAYQRALDANNTADSWIALGDLWQAQGSYTYAAYAYGRAWRQERHYIAASARVGDIQRRLGDLETARAAFVGFYVSEQAVLDWSWQHLQPPPTTRLDVGDGLDFGYVGGMYQAEEQQGTHARWTNGQGLLRLAAPSADQADVDMAMLRLRLAAPRPQSPAEAASAQVMVCAAEQCQTIMLTPTWRTVTLLVPATVDTAGHITVELYSATFVAPDDRQLGVLVDQAELVW